MNWNARIYASVYRRVAEVGGTLNSNLHIKWIFFLSEISSSHALSYPTEKLVDMWQREERRVVAEGENSGICYYVWFVQLIAVYRFYFRIWLTTDDSVCILLLSLLLLLFIFLFLNVPCSHIGNTCVIMLVCVCVSVIAFRLLSMYWSGYRILCVLSAKFDGKFALMKKAFVSK